MGARDLRGEVRDHVTAHPGLTSRDIAKGVSARHADVLAVLAAEPSLLSVTDGAGRALRVEWFARPEGGERPERRSPTHDELVLAVLRGGGWVSSAELYRRTHSMVHSRVASLRRKGFVVEHKGGGGGTESHFYRLVESAERAA